MSDIVKDWDLFENLNGKIKSLKKKNPEDLNLINMRSEREVIRKRIYKYYKDHNATRPLEIIKGYEEYYED